jgi:hypothetical protein
MEFRLSAQDLDAIASALSLKAPPNTRHQRLAVRLKAARTFRARIGEHAASLIMDSHMFQTKLMEARNGTTPR